MRQTVSLHERGSRPYGSGELQQVLHEVREVSHKLKLTPEVKRAAHLCADAEATRYGHGVPHAVLAAAALYIACRENKVPITLREFAQASGADPRDVGRCYLQLLENMHISRPSLNGNGYVYHLALRRPVSDQALSLSQEILNTISERGHGGRNPMTLAAAALYIACCTMGENVTQAEVAEAAGVGEESVRECCKEIRALTKPPLA